MSERRNIYEIQELTKLSCICACGTEMVFDVSQNATFKDCASCGASLYPLPEILRSYAELHRKTIASGLRVRLSSPPIESKD
jgi:hypothetical protein